MGASSSTEQVSVEQREAESLAASTGALPMLQKAFSILSDSQTGTIPLQSLQQCFSLIFENPRYESNFRMLLSHLGPSIVDHFFLAEKGGVSWIEFLRGYVKCCGRMSASASFHVLFKVFTAMTVKAGLPSQLQVESYDTDFKMSGFLVPSDLLRLLLMCWVMRLESSQRKAIYDPPDINHLALSAVLSCAEVSNHLDIWDCDIMSKDMELPAGKILMWALKSVPSLADCFTQFVQGKIQKSITAEDKLEPSCTSAHNLSVTIESNTSLLTLGRAWAISLTMRSTLDEEVMKACFSSYSDGTKESLLYRSSFHGKGLSRFWSNVQGYNGPMLILVAASSGDVHEGGGTVRRWILGALTYEAFENRDTFYGSSGSLYALNPVFNVISSSGKEKNFVYSHLHPIGRVYNPHPKPVGIAFGGSIGNERIFIDEDFAKVTVRHHAVDKTYQPGSLFPNQGSPGATEELSPCETASCKFKGFLPTECTVIDVQVWGLGGRSVKQTQSKYKEREQLFTEQRRKVDLKTFSNWEDSPEKMMMDMVSDPNRVEREDR